MTCIKSAEIDARALKFEENSTYFNICNKKAGTETLKNH